MADELLNKDRVNAEIVNGASDFTEFLSSDTIADIRPTITIIPNILKDIISIGLEHKQLKIKDSNLKRKAELAKKYLELQDNFSQRSYAAEMKRIHSEFILANSQINCERELKLAEIKNEEVSRTVKIKSDERIAIAKIEAEHERDMQELKIRKEAFDEWLRVSDLQFKKKVQESKKMQDEFTAIINSLVTKMINGSLNEYEYKIMIFLSELKIKALQNTFDLRAELIDFFGGGN